MSTAVQPTVLQHDRLYIGGEWVAPGGPQRDASRSSTRRPSRSSATCPEGSAEDADRAVAAARAAFETWSQTPVSAARRRCIAAIALTLLAAPSRRWPR